jgi:hypothetical protein
MRNAIRWIAIVLLQALALLAAAAQGDDFDRTVEQGRLTPISDFHADVGLDTPSGVARSPGVDGNGDAREALRGEIGPIAQSFGASRMGADNAKAPAVEPENATLAAVKALHEELKSLETRIAAQDARIAMLERTLESYTARNR